MIPPYKAWLLATALLGLAPAGGAARAETYPSHPIRLIVPFSAGGVSDLVARQVGAELTKRFGQPVVVENRAGGDGIIGATVVAKAPPDGYTIGLATPGTQSTNMLLQPDLAYNPATDFDPITMAVRTPVVMVINPKIPARTVSEFVAYAKAHPNGLSFASGGIGSSQHLSGALFQSLTGIEMTHVPYKGGAGPITDLISGRVSMFMTSPFTVISFIRNGQLRALAVGSQARLPDLPDVPTLAEAGVKGFDYSSWYGFVAPKGLPPDVLKTLNTNIVDILNKDPVKAAMLRVDYLIVADTPDQFRAEIAKEMAVDRRILKK